MVTPYMKLYEINVRKFPSPYGQEIDREGFGEKFAKECVHREHMSLRYLLNQHTEDNILFLCIASKLCSCEMPYQSQMFY